MRFQIERVHVSKMGEVRWFFVCSAETKAEAEVIVAGLQRSGGREVRIVDRDA